MFGAGTACVVCPVEKILYMDQMLNIPTMSQGAPITMRFYNELTDIQVYFWNNLIDETGVI